MPTQQHDDLDAVRMIFTAIAPFNATERERIMRWVNEKLGTDNPRLSASSSVKRAYKKSGIGKSSIAEIPASALSAAHDSSDIKSYLLKKNPSSVIKTIMAVAHYFKNVAPASARKKAINKQDLIAGFKAVGQKIPSYLANAAAIAKSDGLLTTGGHGLYSITSKGEAAVSGLAQQANAKKPRKKQAANKVAKSSAKVK